MKDIMDTPYVLALSMSVLLLMAVIVGAGTFVMNLETPAAISGLQPLETKKQDG